MIILASILGYSLGFLRAAPRLAFTLAVTLAGLPFVLAGLALWAPLHFGRALWRHHRRMTLQLRVLRSWAAVLHAR